MKTAFALTSALGHAEPADPRVMRPVHPAMTPGAFGIHPGRLA
jgi:hypothetical protein